MSQILVALSIIPWTLPYGSQCFSTRRLGSDVQSVSDRLGEGCGLLKSLDNTFETSKCFIVSLQHLVKLIRVRHVIPVNETKEWVEIETISRGSS